MKYTNVEQIREELWKRFNAAEFCGDIKSIDISFKDSGNKWKIDYHLKWCGTRIGWKGKYYTATNQNTVKYFKSLYTLSKAIVAGYIN